MAIPVLHTSDLISVSIETQIPPLIRLHEGQKLRIWRDHTCFDGQFAGINKDTREIILKNGSDTPRNIPVDGSTILLPVEIIGRKDSEKIINLGIALRRVASLAYGLRDEAP